MLELLTPTSKHYLPNFPKPARFRNSYLCLFRYRQVTRPQAKLKSTNQDVGDARPQERKSILQRQDSRSETPELRQKDKSCPLERCLRINGVSTNRKKTLKCVTCVGGENSEVSYGEKLQFFERCGPRVEDSPRGVSQPGTARILAPE